MEKAAKTLVSSWSTKKNPKKQKTRKSKKSLAAALPAEELQHPCLAMPRVFALCEVVKLALSCNYCNNVRKSFLRAYYSKPSAAVTTAINQGGKTTKKKPSKKKYVLIT